MTPLERKPRKAMLCPENGDREMKKCCLTCSHLEVCPIILAWINATESPMECISFNCSEYEHQESPVEVKK